MSNLDQFIAQLEAQVKNHSIYVWGGSGQLCKDVTEEWIRKKESRCQNGRYADMAVNAWKAVMNSPYRNVARCFDCSGYVSYCLIQVGALDKRRDCDGLYDRCDPLGTVENGALLFKVSSTNPNDETHVGVYHDGSVYESKGRAYGVVQSKYKASDWAKIAWFRALEHNEPTPKPQPEPTAWYVKVLGGSVHVRKGPSVLYRSLGTAHRGDRLPYLGTDEKTGWYKVEYNGQDGYITNKPKYTEVVEVVL